MSTKNSLKEKILDVGFKAGGWEFVHHEFVETLALIIEKQNDSLFAYSITNETFPEYGDVARKSLAETKTLLKKIGVE